MRTEIGLGDLASALVRLDADSETGRSIALMLGGSRLERPRPSIDARSADSTKDHSQDTRENPIERPADKAALTAPSDSITRREQVALEVQDLEPAPMTPPAWLQSRLPAVRRRTDTSQAIDPLLQPRLFASILVALARTWRADGAVDVAALIDVIVRQRPPTHVRRRLQPTLRLGVELLIDRSEAMTPFDADIDQLIAVWRRVVGSGVMVRWFEETPLLAGQGPISEWTTYLPPPEGTPVIAVTDFGVVTGSPELTGHWLEWAALLARAGCPVVGLVPWPRRRHRLNLAPRIPMVAWDRSTTFRSLRDVTRSRTRV